MQDRLYILKGQRRENGAPTIIDTYDNEADLLKWKSRMENDHPSWKFWFDVFEGTEEEFERLELAKRRLDEG